MNPDRTIPGDWFDGRVPENAAIHEGAYLESAHSFLACRSQRPDALEIGRGSAIYVGVMFDLGERARVQIGEFSLLHGARIICDDGITIGDYCLISWGIVLMDTYRVPMGAAERRRCLEEAARQPSRKVNGPAQARPVCIGNNVWIGFDCSILPGVTIGEGSVIGARSVVVDSVPAYSVVAGNPAQVIRRLEPGPSQHHEPIRSTQG
jgi:acetyltransferase-like isoleucine patch superfamily enzyme